MFVCYVNFNTGGTFDFTAASYSDGTGYTESDFYTRGNLEWTRSINKNIMYFGLPAEGETEGGYGYDLGMLEDNFTLSLTISNYEEYARLTQLVKTNTGDFSGVLTIGPSGSIETYSILVRTFSSSARPGEGYMMRVNITMTVVSP